MFNEIYMLVVVRTYYGLVICMFIDTNFRKKTLHAKNACMFKSTRPPNISVIKLFL